MDEHNVTSPAAETVGETAGSKPQEAVAGGEEGTASGNPFTEGLPFAVPVSPEWLRQNAERKKLREASLFVAVPFLLLFALSQFWGDLYYFVTGLLGISDQAAYRFAADPALSQVLQVAFSLLGFVVPFGVAILLAGRRFGELVPLTKPKAGTALPYLLFGLGICSFSNFSTSFAETFFNRFGIPYSVDLNHDAPGVFGFLLSLMATACVPALVEEFACRGVTFSLLRPFGEGFALVVSSLLFGVMHGNFEQMPFAVLVGFGLGLIRIRTGSLWIGVAVHALNNLVSVAYGSLSQIFPKNVVGLATDFYLLALLIVALLAVLLLPDGPKPFRLPKTDCELSLRQRYAAVFTHPAVLAVLILNFGNACRYFF